MDSNWCMIQITIGVIGQIEFNVETDQFVMNLMKIAKIHNLTLQPQSLQTNVKILVSYLQIKIFYICTHVKIIFEI